MVVVVEEAVGPLPSPLALSGSLVADGEFITSVAGTSSQHMSSN